MEKKQRYIKAITKVELEGYKSIKHLEVEFKEGLNIIIGKNASGKSNFFKGLDFVFNSSRKNVKPQKSKVSTNLSDGKNLIYSLSQNFIMPKHGIATTEQFRSLVLGDYTKFSQELWLDKKLIFKGNEKEGVRYIGKDSKTLSNLGVGVNLIQNVLRVKGAVFRLSLLGFNIPSSVLMLDDRASISIDKDGFTEIFEYSGFNLIDENLNHLTYNLTAILIAEKKISRYHIKNLLLSDENISLIVRKFTPIQEFRISDSYKISPSNGNVKIENLFLEFNVDGEWFEWKSLSDGTKRLFYLITETLQHEYGTLLIEEPELGIHPHQFAKLMDFLKEQSETKQIIISTHSPQALDVLSPEELDRIIICEYKKEKGTVMRHLDNHETEKAGLYMENEAFLRDYWIMSDLEE